jgi:hypothetical protein
MSKLLAMSERPAPAGLSLFQKAADISKSTPETIALNDNPYGHLAWAAV